MLKVGLVGLGKMGISHLSIFNSHPLAEVVAVADTSNFITGALGKVTNFKFYKNHKSMLSDCKLDCIVIATPTITHNEIVTESIEKGIHVFVEKPFTLKPSVGKELVKLAENKRIVNQVGYHNKFVATFSKVKDLLKNSVIGKIYSINGEAYGPVVLKKKNTTWRSKKTEGGGCLHDYASHVIDLMNYYIGIPERVGGVIKQKAFSGNVEDVVFASFYYKEGIAGQISVNWSDPTYRKMSTTITIRGDEGKIVVDRQECKIYLQRERRDLNLLEGWNILYTTDVTKPVWFYLRGEEYSSQIDYFISCILGKKETGLNSFRSALDTDLILEKIENQK